MRPVLGETAFFGSATFLDDVVFATPYPDPAALCPARAPDDRHLSYGDTCPSLDGCGAVPGFGCAEFFEEIHIGFNRSRPTNGDRCRLSSGYDTDLGHNDLQHGVFCDGHDGAWGVMRHAVAPGFRLMARRGDPPPCRSLFLDGASGIDLGDGENLLGLGEDLTLATWVFVDAAAIGSPQLHLVSFEQTNSSDPGQNSGAGLFVHDGVFAFHAATGHTGTDDLPDPWWLAPDPLPRDRWVHLAATRSGDGAIRLYQDGALVLDGLSAWDGPLSWDGGGYEHDLYTLGLAHPNGALRPMGHVLGALRDVAAWGRVLSDVEVLNLVATGPSDDDPDLATWWPIDEGTGDVLGDRGPGGFTGLVSGVGTWTDDCP